MLKKSKNRSVEEYGIVESINHPLLLVKGLPNARSGDTLIFENGAMGQVLNFSHAAEVMLFSEELVKVGSRCLNTGQTLSLHVSTDLLGAVVDPLGKSLEEKKPVKSLSKDCFFKLAKYGNLNDSEFFGKKQSSLLKFARKREAEKSNKACYLVDSKATALEQRAQLKEPLVTASAIVDLLLPLAKGQRELVVGDRKTGKTSFLLNLAENQIRAGAIVIYALIGKKMSEIKAVRQYFIDKKLNQKIVIVAAGAKAVPSIIYLTPFSAMTIAEYFRDQSKDVLLILDDLSTHAKFYREISLLARKFPGRDSYPGDIFYTHARLLERAGNFKSTVPAKKENSGVGQAEPKIAKAKNSATQASDTKINPTVSISCLPVANTIESDLTDYIVSNLISITDGHLLFDAAMVRSGQHPAINVALSVTRVGKQVQSQVVRELNTKLLAFMNKYRKSMSFSHFGAELTAETQFLINKGEAFEAFLLQKPEEIIPLPVQVVVAALLWFDYLLDFEAEQVRQLRQQLTKTYLQNQEMRDLFDNLFRLENLDELKTELMPLKEKIKEILKN
ncbi:MAG: hypothetical protein PVJ09_00110 [Candidatus Woesebacteria bacterium]|jgi:F-type H+-transporting ATPase subunit alpha